jgi:NADH:ubiquinone oxidoreductase subunit 4 (subunit M)
VIVAPLLLLVFWMGIYPISFTSIFGPTVTDFIQDYGPRMEAVAADPAATNP